MSEAKGTPGGWKFRTVYSEDEKRRIALLLEKQDVPEGADPCILAVREDWIRFLLDTPEGKDRLARIAALPALEERVRALEALLGRFYSATYGKTDLVPPLDFEQARSALSAPAQVRP